MDGFIVVDKPAGVTSHDVVSAVRRIAGQRKVGHTGTLDPFVRLLSLPKAWHGFLETNTSGTSCLGPLAGLQAQRELYERTLRTLADPERTTLVLVSRPEITALREAERWAKRRAKPASPPRIQDPNEAAAADQLRLALGTKVEIVAKSKDSGEIKIHYYGQEELMRLYTILVEKTIPTEPSHAIQEGKSGR